MKITSIKIGKWHQFKDFDLPLIYPYGHHKEGKPLDKVCFIGQSGTGKTSLLKILRLAFDANQLKDLSTDELRNFQIGLKLDLSDTKKFNWNIGEAKIIDGNDALQAKINKEFQSIQVLQINFPADLPLNSGDSNMETTAGEKKHYDFSVDKAESLWNFILSDIQKYQETELRMRQDISKAVENYTDFKGIEEEVAKLKAWKSETLNPIDDIAKNCLNTLLAPINLRVKTDLDFKTKEDLGFIKIEDFKGNEIPNGLLSTGTRQIILTALPLYLLKPENTLIFFDEPERSLFPDMQRILVDYYSSFAVRSQFFYATHSPIIASAFEPCERICLYFDEKGNVQWKNGVAPEGDDPNDLLKKDFGMENLMLDEGIAKYKEYLAYKTKIRHETDERKKNILILEMTKLGESYNF